MNLDDFQQIYNELDDQGYVPRYIDGYSVDGEAFYAAVWEQTNDDLNVRYNLTSQQLELFTREMDDHRFEPVQISGYSVNGEPRYAAIFRAIPVTKRYTLRYDMDQAKFNQVYNELHSQGYIVNQISSFTLGNESFPRYAAIWYKSSQGDDGRVVNLGLDYDQYLQLNIEMHNNNYVLVDEAATGIFG
jgi:uncharacterized protein (UPF0297 family)